MDTKWKVKIRQNSQKNHTKQGKENIHFHLMRHGNIIVLKDVYQEPGIKDQKLVKQSRR